MDDVLIMWNSYESLAKVKESLKAHFKMKDLGSAQFPHRGRDQAKARRRLLYGA